MASLTQSPIEFTELGTDGSVLEWKKHFLSDLLRAKSYDHLMLEPIIHPKGAFASRHVRVNRSEEYISWQWDKWARLDITPWMADEAAAPISYYHGESTSVRWEQLPICEALELTPFDSSGEPGVTLRLDRPAEAIKKIVKIEQYDEGHVSVSIRTGGSNHNIYVQRLKRRAKEQTYFEPDGNLIPLKNNLCSVPVGPKFHGVIAVIQYREGEKWLLAYRGYQWEQGLIPAVYDKKEEEKVLKAIGNRPSGEQVLGDQTLILWICRWPGRSRRLLVQLHTEAKRFLDTAVSAKQVYTYPTGLLRALALKRCEPQLDFKVQDLIIHLNKSNFAVAIESLSPSLPPVLAVLQSPKAKLWAILNARNDRLAAAVKWVGDRGVDALNAALDLADVYTRASHLKDALRPDSKMGSEIATIFDYINQAPFTGRPSGDFNAELNNIEARLKLEKANPEGPEPSLKVMSTVWKTAVEEMMRWRWELSNVIAHCEDGLWETRQWEDAKKNLKAAPSPEELYRRLGQLLPPDIYPSWGADAGSGKRLAAVINDLLSRKDHEPRTELRNLSVTQLNEVVLRHANYWTTLHQQIKNVRSQINYFPWFAEKSGLTALTGKSLNARAQAANAFLEMTQAVSEHLKFEWSELGLGKDKLRSILATPDHPIIEAALKECFDIRELLHETEYLQDIALPQSAPLRPRDTSLKGLREWWEQLRDLDKKLARCKQARIQYTYALDKMLDSIKPFLEEKLDYWKRLPREQRPQFYDELSRTYARIQEAIKTETTKDKLTEDMNQIRRIIEKHDWRNV